MIGLGLAELFFIFASFSVWFAAAYAFCDASKAEGCAKTNLWGYFLSWSFSVLLLAAVPITAWRGTKHPFWLWFTGATAMLMTAWYVWFAMMS